MSVCVARVMRAETSERMLDDLTVSQSPDIYRLQY